LTGNRQGAAINLLELRLNLGNRLIDGQRILPPLSPLKPRDRFAQEILHNQYLFSLKINELSAPPS
jgi:hypothetical protein